MIQAGGGGGGGGGCAAVEAEEVMVADRLGDLARINRSTLNLVKPGTCTVTSSEYSYYGRSRPSLWLNPLFLFDFKLTLTFF